MEYLIFAGIFLLLGLVTTLVFSKILHVKVFGGAVSMLIVATSGSLLGAYYLPRLTKIWKITLDLPSAALGAIILVIFLHFATPKSLK